MPDHDLERLYQIPLGEFTSTRNMLAKARGAAGTAIKSLEKPSLPAWAVNQVFWHARKEWDTLVEASQAVRQAHVHVISGRTADVATAEATHTQALRSAAAAARRLAEAAGEKITPATAEAIYDTLQALPSPDTPGQLVKPLKPLGFAALMNMGIPVVSTPAAPRGRADADRRAAEKALRTAEARETLAEAALDEAKTAAAAADRELERVRDTIVFLEKQRSDATELVRQRTRELQDAANARIQAAQDLRH